ncbi:hypothetical protein FISHEDRAFT_43682 [Fistulina hepatica ATCC 64428]|uniref:RING-type domain-containing protein n=1 Tax=Fistulina hepatica ATCC 64428 TaxID=1128425 RepID=A0A0D7AEN3_9AGAR|nr:hypothetical protein FISHEDRAFT_43682 [Fistulina hepatica ATCC 64428]
MDAAYCAMCDKYFPDDHARRAHIQSSKCHPRCDKCDKRFLNRTSLSCARCPRHRYCEVCDMHFKTAVGLRVRVDYASKYRSDSDEETNDIEEQAMFSHAGWRDNLETKKFPRFTESPYFLDDLGASDDEMFEGSRSNPPWESDDQYDFPDIDDSEVTSCVDDDKAHEMVDVLQLTCPLCKREPHVACVTQCGHLFCTTCGLEAVLADECCPICEEPSFVGQLKKIYLNADAQ